MLPYIPAAVWRGLGNVIDQGLRGLASLLPEVKPPTQEELEAAARKAAEAKRRFGLNCLYVSLTLLGMGGVMALLLALVCSQYR